MPEEETRSGQDSEREDPTLVTYHCKICRTEWRAIPPRAARLATGRPVHCHGCGEVAWYGPLPHAYEE